MKGCVIMAILSENGKIKLANEYTSLAIQHGLINNCGNSEDTALEVCKFFRTLYFNIDRDNSESQE